MFPIRYAHTGDARTKRWYIRQFGRMAWQEWHSAGHRTIQVDLQVQGVTQNAECWTSWCSTLTGGHAPPEKGELGIQNLSGNCLWPATWWPMEDDNARSMPNPHTWNQLAVQSETGLTVWIAQEQAPIKSTFTAPCYLLRPAKQAQQQQRVELQHELVYLFSAACTSQHLGFVAEW